MSAFSALSARVKTVQRLSQYYTFCAVLFSEFQIFLCSFRYCFLLNDCIVLGQPLDKSPKPNGPLRMKQVQFAHLLPSRLGSFVKSLNLLQVLELRGSVLKLDVKTHLKNAWVVQTPKRKFVIGATSSEDRQRWVDAMTRAFMSLDPASVQPQPVAASSAPISYGDSSTSASGGASTSSSSSSSSSSSTSPTPASQDLHTRSPSGRRSATTPNRSRTK